MRVPSHDKVPTTQAHCTLSHQAQGDNMNIFEQFEQAFDTKKQCANQFMEFDLFFFK